MTVEKHGRPVAVVMSTEDYREYQALKLHLLKGEIDRGLADLAAGRVVDGGEAFAAARGRI